MGTHSGGSARAQHPLVRILLVMAGIILLVAGGCGALFMLAFFFFSGTDLLEEVGSTGEGAGGAITSLIAICVVIAIFGWSLIRPDDHRSRRPAAIAADPGETPLPGIRRQPAPVVYRSPTAAVVVLIVAVILSVSTIVLFVLSLQLDLTALLGWVFLGGILQFVLGIVGLVLARKADPARRRRYRVAGWITAAGNPLTLIALLFLLSAIRDLVAPR